MIKSTSVSRKIFMAFNYFVLLAITFICILPFLHLISVSLSSNLSAAAGEVGLIPKGFTLQAYQYIIKKREFIVAMLISFERVFMGTALSLFLVILTAYPLSKSNRDFKQRTVYTWIFAFTMFFSGGLIPTYMVVRLTGIIDSIWALILPGAVSAWNIVLMLNFFRQVPKELEEAAIIDGAGHWKILWRIYLPVSVPAVVTILLFIIIFHWNSWFDGILYMNKLEKYPLQTYLYTVVMSLNSRNLGMLSPDEFERVKNINEKTVKTAQIFLGALPILLVYPFLQRFFVKGLIIGSVKG